MWSKLGWAPQRDCTLGEAGPSPGDLNFWKGLLKPRYAMVMKLSMPVLELRNSTYQDAWCQATPLRRRLTASHNINITKQHNRYSRLYYSIILDHIILYHIILNHIISYHIISYHTILYHIILYYIISYHKIAVVLHRAASNHCSDWIYANTLHLDVKLKSRFEKRLARERVA